MVKIKKLAVVLASLCVGGLVFADDSLQQLQSQIDALTQQLQSVDAQNASKGPQSNLVVSNSNLAKIGASYDRNKIHLDRDLGFYIDAQPNVTYELAILQQQQQHPFEGVAIGGYFEQDIQYWGGDSITTTSNTTYSHGSGAYFTSLDLDILANLNTWTSVLIRPEIYNLGTSSESLGMHDAFITFGNLSQFPLYATVGKTYIPWGIFAGGGVWNASLTRVAFRPGTTNQAIFGYYENGLSTSLSFFDAPGFGSQINHFAYRMAYNTSQGKVNYGGGFGYLSDIRGTTSSLGSQFGSSGVLNNVNNIRNPVYNFNATAGYGIFQFDAAWITTQRDVFTSSSVNQGKPQAWNVDGSVSPMVIGTPVTFMLGYSHTSHMQGVPMGLNGASSPGYSTASGLTNQWTATATRQILKGYYLGLEASRNKLYNGQKTYEFTIDNSVYF